ncbi:hypothetical protein [Embleya sp. NPDC001921]
MIAALWFPAVIAAVSGVLVILGISLAGAGIEITRSLRHPHGQHRRTR